MNAFAIIFYVGVPLIALRFGIYWGRTKSFVALGVCLAVVAAAAVIVRILYGHGAGEWWETADDPWYQLTTGIGMTALFSMLAFIGPATFRDWRWATLLSLGVVAAFVLTGLPVLYVMCILFGACI